MTATSPNTLTDETRIRRDERRRVAELLRAMAEDLERFGGSGMARLDDLAKAQAYREAARRVEGLE